MLGVTSMAELSGLEIYQAKQLVRLLDHTDGLELPVCIGHRDKPDFLLYTRARKIGLETSNFTDEEVMRADYLHHARYPKAFITTTGLRDGSKRRSSDEIAQTMLAWDAPWEDSIEGAEHVARKIFDSIRIKQQKLRSSTFERFDENWLLLTDYRNPFSDVITDEILARQLLAAIQRDDTIGTEFDRIYVFYGPRCFRIAGKNLSTKLDKQNA
jgi:hypothetical protein